MEKSVKLHPNGKRSGEDGNFEQTLRLLFDYQKFEGNEKLGNVIGRVGGSSAKELTDDDVGFVNAAGDGTYPDGSDGNGNVKNDF